MCIVVNEIIFNIVFSAASLMVESAAFYAYSSPPNGTIIQLSNTLPNLTYLTTGGLLVASQTNFGPLGYLIDGFPKTVTFSRDNIVAKDTTSTDLSFLSNVVCSPGVLMIADNLNLTSLSGINIWPTGVLQRVIASNNPLLNRTGYGPLGALLECGSEPPTAVTVDVAPSDCRRLTNVAELCFYIGFGCPIAPPPPPSPPPPAACPPVVPDPSGKVQVPSCPKVLGVEAVTVALLP